MVFNAVQNSSASSVETLTLTDTGNASLTLGSSALKLVVDPTSSTNDTARFSIVNLSSVPATLSPGGSFALQLDYSANAVVTNKAILDITTNDPANPLQTVSLHGIGTKGLGGSNQPSLATILQAYNIPTYVGEGYDDANAATDSIYPYPPDASSQEVALQSMVKAGPGPVTIDVLASFTASGFSKSYVLGTYTPGNPNSLSQLFYTSSTQNQTTNVQPIGATTFDPGANAFGFYFVSNVQTAGRIGYSEDALNTWDSTTGRHFRFFPMENPDGSIVPNTYIMTSTEWNAPIGYDFTNIVAIVHNIKAAPNVPAAPAIGLQNMNPLPGTSRMLFSTIQNHNTSTGDIVHNTGVLKINNTGDEPLVVSSYSISSGWELVNPPTFPLTVAAGSSYSLTIEFDQTSVPSHSYNETNDVYEPNGGAAMTGTLTLNSNDPNHPSSSITLAGYFQTQSEDSEEPSLQTIVNLLAGWSTDINSSPIPDLTETTATTGSPTYYGDEVVSAYWTAADPGSSVTVQQLDAYHTEGNTATVYWYPQGKSGTHNKLFNTVNLNGQTLFPDTYGTTTPAAASFTTTGNFGFDVDGIFSDDTLNKGTPGVGHHFRFFPIIDASGNVVPNTYIMTMDYTATPENFDFQDNVYIVSNIRPVTKTSGISGSETTAAAPTPTDFYSAGTTSGVSLEWAPVSDSTLSGYDIYRSTSLTGTYALLNSSPITTTSYTDHNASGGTTYYYKLTALDSSLGTASLPASSFTTALASSVTVPPTPGNLTATGIAGGVSLAWSAVSDSTLAGYDVYSSSSASGPFTLLTSSPISATTYTDSTATVGATTYYQVTAVDASSGLSSSAASASGTALAVTGLQSIDIGATPSGSTTVVTPGTDFNVTAGGPGIANNADGFRFIYQTQTGNFDVKVQVTSLTVAGNYSTAGILARTALTTTSPDVYVSASPVNYRFKYRTTDGGVNEIATGGTTAFPNAWVRLTRVGNVFTGYYSTNGTTWTELYSLTNALPSTIYLGLAVASNNTTQTTTATLRSYGNTTTTTPTPPAAVTGFFATGETSAVQLNWNASSDSTLKGYDVYRSNAANGTYTVLTPSPITATTYTDSTAPVGVTSFYEVTVIDASSGLASTAATASAIAKAPTATAPAAPTGLSATGITSAVTLSWTAVSDATLKGYNVYSSSSANGTYTLLTSTPITATTYTDSTATVGVTTYYHVTAVDASSGLESTATAASAIALAPVTSGLQSIDIGATPSGSTTVVTPGTDFNVTAGGPGIANNADGFRFIYQTQTGNFDVKVQVTSLTVAGNYSTAGILARSTLTTTSPDVYMSVSPVNYRFKYRTSDGGVNEVATGGTTAFPNAWVRLTRVGNVFTGYYSTNGTTWTEIYSLTNALPSTLYLGLAVASNVTTQTTTATLRSYGNTTTPTAPAAVTGFTATGETAAVALSWNASSDSTLKGYDVYRSNAANGTYTLLTSSPITATTYTDSTAPVGVASFYEVTAIDASSGLASTPANASATATAAAVNLTSVDIGASPSGSTTTVTPGSAYTVTAGGPGVGGTSDGFRYLYTSVTGNFDVKVQVASITVAGNYSTGGLMARSTLDADSANVYISASPANYRFKDRTTTAGTEAVAAGSATSFPNAWVRLQRVGNVFNAYTSTNGTTWTLMSTVTIALPTTLDLGLAVASNVSTTTTTAVLQNYGNS
jgi:fibronectin type 3 domain-containing protein